MLLLWGNEWAEKFEQYIKSAGIGLDNVSISWLDRNSFSRFNASSFSAGFSSSFQELPVLQARLRFFIKFSSGGSSGGSSV